MYFDNEALLAVIKGFHRLGWLSIYLLLASLIIGDNKAVCNLHQHLLELVPLAKGVCCGGLLRYASAIEAITVGAECHWLQSLAMTTQH